jgi:hypothetical protein
MPLKPPASAAEMTEKETVTVPKLPQDLLDFVGGDRGAGIAETATARRALRSRGDLNTPQEFLIHEYRLN